MIASAAVGEKRDILTCVIYSVEIRGKSPQVLERLLTRVEKRMDALHRVKLPGFEMVISELEVERNYLLRARRYLEQTR